MPDFVLCKIAVEIQKDSCHFNSACLKYNSKIWRPLFFFGSNVDVKRILITNQRHRTGLEFTEIQSEQPGQDGKPADNFLALAYRPFAEGRIGAHSPIFPAIFKDYNTPSCVVVNEFADFMDLTPRSALHALPGEQVDERQPLLPQQELSKRYVTTELYEALYKRHCKAHAAEPLPRTSTAALQLPAEFLPTLCRYQEASVRWLLQREKLAAVPLPSFYMRLEARDGVSGVFYMHKYMTHVQREAPALLRLPPGGILADEMGLGKTVEMLALVLLNPRTNFSIAMPAFQSNCITARKAKRVRKRPQIFCICGSKNEQNLKECAKCLLWQHARCVGEVTTDENATADAAGTYLCPNCWHELTCADDSESPKVLLPTGATFIVTQTAIKSQWLAEIHRHTNGLRVLVYEGVGSSNWISPQRLATDYDIVLTDYAVLRSEFHHSATSSNRTERVTRNKPRFMRLHTPLLMLEWWRVCLDEAQMVESNTSQAALLVRMLPAVNRWAVTGTPIQRCIDDLLPLLRFIGFEEAALDHEQTVWNNLVYDFALNHKLCCNDEEHLNTQRLSFAQRPSPLIDVLQLCMWRTCKSKVADELLIPPQSEEVHHIRLSNLEKLFYMEQHADCAQKFNETVDKHIQRAQTISTQIMKKILQPLLKIRQCCNMPVIHDKNVAAGNNSQKPNFMQPKELHAHLKSVNKVDCKSELRTMASAYNGMAGIFFLRKDYAQAIKHYQLVLQLARDYSDINLSVDRLLEIHALHNMLQAYYISPDQHEILAASTLEGYEQQRDELEWRYLKTYAETLVSAKSAMQQADLAMLECFATATQNTSNKVINEAVSETEAEKEAETEAETCKKAVEEDSSDSSNVVEFIAELLDTLDLEQEEQLVNRIHEECFGKFPDNARIEPIQSARTALLSLSQWWGKVTKTDQGLRAQFADLHFFTENIRVRNQVNTATWRRMMDFISSVYDCHLSEIREHKPKEAEAEPVDKTKKVPEKLCKLCTIQNLLNAYECLLWNKTIDEETNVSEGLELPSMEICLIKIIFNFMKLKHKVRTRIAKHTEALECMQNWCKKLFKFWVEIEYTVKAYDELDMCKMRISLSQDKDDKSIYRIAQYEMDNTFADNQLNFYDAQRKFAVKLARLKYLMHLESDAVDTPCPICCSENEAYVVLECGHHICCSCLKQVRHYNKQAPDLSCPICRNKQDKRKIYYVMRDSEEPLSEAQPLVGNYSSKIAYIVRFILRLKAEHSQQKKEPPKILIFSQWMPILTHIAGALEKNNIQHRLKWSPQTIEEFKSPDLGVTCLLMLLSRGSKGLNIIEATHVFLVEPILSPSEELQAIGRVHRFGQTKATTVHRFIVWNTIEENVYNMVTRGREREANWEFNKLSLKSLRDLFKLDNDLIEDMQSEV